MKKIFIPAAILALFAFNSISYDTTKATATVQQLQGVYIFVDSKPVAEYKYLGTVKLSRKENRQQINSGQYQNVRDALLTRLKKDYPAADGAIFSFYDGGADQVDAIQFK